MEGDRPKIPANWICDFEEENTWRVDDAKAFDCRYVLGEDKFGVCSRMEETFSMPGSLG